MHPRTRILLGLAALGLLLAILWWARGSGQERGELTLYGNIDLRQVELPFNGSERIAEVLVQEGDRVEAGQVLARLDTSRLQPQLERAEAQVAMQQQVIKRLRNGSRPEEIAQARANVAAVRAEATDTRAQWQRLRALQDASQGRAVSSQELDAARAALDGAEARLAVAQQALALRLAGPREEEIAQAEAELRADQAQLVLLRQQLEDAELRAPRDAVVRSRIVEPGEIASPQKPAFTLAIVNPKWVRAYVAEPDLGALQEGMAARISTDAFKEQSFEGRVGFISSVAEFTPRTVETTELRSSLVYEVRVFVQDADDRLRLGMPATVHLSTKAPR